MNWLKASTKKRLLRGAALPIDGGAGYAFRQARRQQGIAGDIAGLFAGLPYALHDDIVDEFGWDLGALDQRIQDLSRQIDRMKA